MSGIGKYTPLKNFLLACEKRRIILTYHDVEEIIHDKLPESAYKYSEAWWSNTEGSPQASAWLEAGYETDYVTDTYKQEKITFVKR